MPNYSGFWKTEMKLAVFTSNQPRHFHLIAALAEIAETVYAVQECNTVFPGKVKDFYDNSPVMRAYFERVMDAEKTVFGELAFMPDNVRTLSLKDGDLNDLSLEILKPVLKADYCIVFGASFIKAPLIDALIAKRTINIHMGVSPYYRGSSCNFWALYDKRPELVGATIHLLGRGLDSGAILYHALPDASSCDPFDLGMKAVKSAHESLVERIRSGEIETFSAVEQDKSKELRYTRNMDFTDDIAKRYLESLPSPENIAESLCCRNLELYLHPYILNAAGGTGKRGV